MKRATIIFVGMLAACTHIPERSAHEELPRVSWERGLEEGPKVEVIPLFTGEVKVERSFVLDFENPALKNREENSLWVPVMAYLVRHPVHGDVLIDTGFDPTFAESGHGNFGGLAVFVDLARQKPGHDTVSLLRELGVDPAALKRIVLSHMHPDHTAGLPALPASVPLLVGEGALQSYGAPWYAPADHLAGRSEVHELSLPEDGRALDLFGDGSFLALPTPGHAHGNLSFLLRAQGGPVLLTCDASHTQEGFGHGVAPGGVIDRADADASLARLRAFAAEHSVRVKAGHDAGDWDLERGVQEAL